MSKHTPGPWEAKYQGELGPQWPCWSIDVRTPDREQHSHIAEVYYVGANARLIAAAPDLLDVVRKLAAYCEYTDLPLDLAHGARDAIRKAEGRAA